MVRTQLYLPQTLKKELTHEAKFFDISFSELVRRRLMYNLNAHKPFEKPNAVTQLLNAVERVRKSKARGPKDLSKNHDEYLYGDKRL